MEEKILCQIHRYIQLIQSVWAESRACMLEYNILARLSAHSDWISCTYVGYLAQYPRFQFCGLIYIQFINLWIPPHAELQSSYIKQVCEVVCVAYILLCSLTIHPIDRRQPKVKRRVTLDRRHKAI